MTNKKQALQLVEQLIEEAEKQDLLYRSWSIKNNKATRATGESFMVFHLKALRGLIENDDEWYTM